MRWLLLLALVGCDRRPVAPAPLSATPPVEGVTVDPRVRVDARATVLAVGDIMMHGMVKRSAEQADVLDDAGATTNNGGYDALFTHVRDLVAGADLAFGNLETPVAPDHEVLVKEMHFNAPPHILRALAHTGFDIVSFANNHSYDQGRPGLVETVQRLSDSELAFVGAGATCADAWRAVTLDANGIRIAWIGSTALYNKNLNAGDDDPCVATFDETRAVAEATAAREAGADFVILSVHWGVEYSSAPEVTTAEAARRVIDGGVDVILGHHPHVLQPIELREAPDGRIGMIAFSLGNFISNQSAWYRPGVHGIRSGNTRDGLALQFDVVRKDYGRRDPILRTELAAVRAIPLWTENNTHSRRSEPVLIRVHPADAVAADTSTLLAQAEEAGDEDAIVAARRRLDHLARRRAGVEAIVGHGLLPPAP